jgi:hypothetical protein
MGEEVARSGAFAAMPALSLFTLITSAKNVRDILRRAGHAMFAQRRNAERPANQHGCLHRLVCPQRLRRVAIAAGD